MNFIPTLTLSMMKTLEWKVGGSILVGKWSPIFWPQERKSKRCNLCETTRRMLTNTLKENVKTQNIEIQNGENAAILLAVCFKQLALNHQHTIFWAQERKSKM